MFSALNILTNLCIPHGYKIFSYIFTEAYDLLTSNEMLCVTWDKAKFILSPCLSSSSSDTRLFKKNFLAVSTPWEVPGPGSNPSHSSDNVRFLTHWATRELLFVQKTFLVELSWHLKLSWQYMCVSMSFSTFAFSLISPALMPNFRSWILYVAL